MMQEVNMQYKPIDIDLFLPNILQSGDCVPIPHEEIAHSLSQILNLML